MPQACFVVTVLGVSTVLPVYNLCLYIFNLSVRLRFDGEVGIASELLTEGPRFEPGSNPLFFSHPSSAPFSFHYILGLRLTCISIYFFTGLALPK
jgi:hypothetical protein